MNYDNTKFFNLLKEFGGIRRIIKSRDFIYSIILSALISVVGINYGISYDILNNFNLSLITVGAALVAIIIAGLAIVVSTSDDHFVSILRTAGIYGNILFPFWYSAVMAGVGVIINSISYIILLIFDKVGYFCIFCISKHVISLNLVYGILVFLSFFSIIYALFLAICLVESIIKYGLYRVEFIKKEQEKTLPNSNSSSIHLNIVVSEEDNQKSSDHKL